MTKYLILALLFVASCKSQFTAMQTSVHDLSNEVKENLDKNKAHGQFLADCAIQRVEFSPDSFAFYTRCPNEANFLRKDIIGKSYPLINK